MTAPATMRSVTDMMSPKWFGDRLQASEAALFDLPQSCAIEPERGCRPARSVSRTAPALLPARRATPPVSSQSPPSQLRLRDRHGPRVPGGRELRLVKLSRGSDQSRAASRRLHPPQTRTANRSINPTANIPGRPQMGRLPRLDVTPPHSANCHPLPVVFCHCPAHPART